MPRSRLNGSMPRLDEAMAEEIVKLDMRGLSQVKIAEKTGVNRTTVQRVLARTRAALRITHDLSGELARALALYRSIQAEAWQAIEETRSRGRSPATLLAEVRLAQTRIDTLLGLAPAADDDPRLEFSRFRAAVTEALETESPHLAGRIAERLDRTADLIGAEGRRGSYDSG